jgi:hypothetical protein
MPRHDDLAASGSLTSYDQVDTARSASRCTPSPRSPPPVGTTETGDTVTVLTQGDQLGEAVTLLISHPPPAPSASWRRTALAPRPPCAALLVFRPPLIRPAPPVDIFGGLAHNPPPLLPPISSLGSIHPLNQLLQRGATTPLHLPSRSQHSQHPLGQASKLAQATLAPRCTYLHYLHYLQKSNVTDPAASSRAASPLLCPFSPCLDRQSNCRESLTECCLLAGSPPIAPHRRGG